MADSNSCALVIRLRKEKRVVALPKVKFLDKNLSFQEVFTDVYDGDLHVRVKCRVGFKKPGDAEPKDFVSVDLTENVGAIVNALSANFVDFDVLDEEPQAKAVKPLNAFDVLMKAASTEILPPELHNRPLQLAKILYPGAGFPPAEVKSSGVAFFKKLTNIAWYLDPRIPKFIERSLKMPKLIMGLYDDIDNVALAASPQSFIGYNDWRGKKKARPQILHEELSEKVAEVYDMQQFAWLARSEWKTFKQDLEEIGNSMKKYHYKAFDDIFGQDTVEVDRPGAKTQENKSGKAYFTKEKVRDAVECVSCGKWRCVYAPTKPPRASTDQFHQAVDTLMYTCGAPILPEGHPVAEIFIVRQDISCSDPVEKQYYSCKNFDLICCRCGSTEPDALVNEEMKRQYKVVNPVCRACSEKGAKPVVSAPKTVTASAGKKKKKP